jgi:anti-anti-sigma factor
VGSGLLTVTVEERAAYCVVAASGELDVSTTAQLRATLQERLVDAADVHLVIDLSGLAFMDSSGLGTLVRAHKQARTLRGTFAVVCADGPVRKVIELTGMVHVLRVFDTLEAATAEPVRGA